jgi:serine protease Do
MKTIATTALLLSVWLTMSGARSADNNSDLKTSLGDVELQGNWIYNDISAGFAESKKTGKPLLVVFRCVP